MHHDHDTPADRAMPTIAARLEERRREVRRFLLHGAIAALVLGVLAQPVLGAYLEGEVLGVARVAFLIPALAYIGWWLLSPGLARELETDVAADLAAERVERAEALAATIDSAVQADRPGAPPRDDWSRLGPSIARTRGARQAFQGSSRAARAARPRDERQA